MDYGCQWLITEAGVQTSTKVTGTALSAVYIAATNVDETGLTILGLLSLDFGSKMRTGSTRADRPTQFNADEFSVHDPLAEAMRINDLLSFDFMDPPPAPTVLTALEPLYALSVFDGCFPLPTC